MDTFGLPAQAFLSHPCRLPFDPAPETPWPLGELRPHFYVVPVLYHALFRIPNLKRRRELNTVAVRLWKQVMRPNRSTPSRALPLIPNPERA